MLVVAVVILAGVVAVASGRGGEMAVPEPDYPPIDLGPVSAADVALLRPPLAAQHPLVVRIERTGGLVEDHHRRLGEERAGYADALALPAG